MEQYSSNGNMDTPASPVKVSEESKKIHAIDELVKSLQEKLMIQQHELAKQGRDINRLKNDIELLTNAIRNRG